jgi:hypothetical protein
MDATMRHSVESMRRQRQHDGSDPHESHVGLHNAQEEDIYEHAVTG